MTPPPVAKRRSNLSLRAEEVLRLYRAGERDFRALMLDGVRLDLAVLEGADFSRSSLIAASLRAADLSGAHFGEAILRGADLGKAQLARASLRRADLRRARFDEADLEGADLTASRADFAMFRRSNLSYARMRSITGHGTCLAGSDLTGADLEQGQLTNPDLSTACLHEVIAGPTVFLAPDFFQGAVRSGCAGEPLRFPPGVD